MEQTEARDIALEKHYTVFEVAEQWGYSHTTIRKLFEEEPGVLMIGSDETRWSRKRKAMRIPESVIKRVHEKHHAR